MLFLVFGIVNTYRNVMNRIGRKNTVLYSFLFNIIGLIIPFIYYSFFTIIVAFAFIGMGNTILQVSLNPLMIDVVSKDKLTGTLTLGQFIKAISSFLGPIVAALVAGSILEWRMIFPIYAFLSLVALLWLWLTPIDEVKQTDKPISIKDTLDLFKDNYIKYSSLQYW